MPGTTMTRMYHRPPSWPACLTEAVPPKARKVYLQAEEARAAAAGASKALTEAKGADYQARIGNGDTKPSVAADRLHTATKAAETAADTARQADKDLADAMAATNVTQALQEAEAAAWARLEAAAEEAERAAQDAAALGMAVMAVQTGTSPSQWRWPPPPVQVNLTRLAAKRPQAIAARRKAEEAERAREAAKPQTRDGIHLPGRRSFAT